MLAEEGDYKPMFVKATLTTDVTVSVVVNGIISSSNNNNNIKKKVYLYIQQYFV